MAFVHADQKAAISTGVTSLAVTFALAVTAKDALCCAVRQAGATAPTISDNINGTWPLVGSGYLNNVSAGYVLSSGAASANSLVVTCTASGGTSGVIRIAADRFSGGPASFVTSSNNPLQSGTSGDLGTISGDAGSHLLYGGGGTGTNSATFTAGTSGGVSAAIGVQLGDAANGSVFSEYVLSTAAGTQTMTWTVSPTISTFNGWEFTLAAVDPFPAYMAQYVYATSVGALRL